MTNYDSRFDLDDPDLEIRFGEEGADYEDEYDEYDDFEDDGQPDEMQEWEGLADAGYGTDEDYGYYGDDGEY